MQSDYLRTVRLHVLPRALSPVIVVLVVGVLELDGVKGRGAAPVNDQALVGNGVGQEEVVSCSVVVALIGQDAAGIPAVRVGPIAAVDRWCGT